MLNSNLEALPSQIRAKSLACAIAAAQNDPQKPRTRDISFGGYWPGPQGKKEVSLISSTRGVPTSQLSAHISSNQVRWTP